MSSRRSSASGNLAIFCPEVVNGFEQARTRLQAQSAHGLEVGVLCGYTNSKSSVFFQCSIQVPLAPHEKVGPNGRELSAKQHALEALDDALIKRFASKLHRMLCGATQVVGIYAISTADILNKQSASFETILKALYLDRTTTTLSTTKFFAVSVNLTSGALMTHRYAFGPKTTSPTPEPMQFRVLQATSQDLVPARTTWKLDLLLPVKRSISGPQESRFHKTMLKIITDEINKVNAAIFIDTDTQEVAHDEEFDQTTHFAKLGVNTHKLPDIIRDLETPASSSSKTTKKNAKHASAKAETSTQNLNRRTQHFSMFSRHASIHEANSLQVHQVASGALRLRGSIVGTAAIPLHETQNARFLRLDVIRSLQSRFGYLFDHIASQKTLSPYSEEDADKTSLGRAKSFVIEIPRRVILKKPLQQAYFCDYLHSDEPLEACKERFKVLLGLDDDFEVEVLEKEAIQIPWNDEELSDMPSDSVTTRNPSRTNGSALLSGSTTSQRLGKMLVFALIGILLAIGVLLLTANTPSTISPAPNPSQS